MHIELIDLLRCPREHEETWLVAAFTRIQDRVVYEGRLGCPVCNAAYPIDSGVASFASQSGVSALRGSEPNPDPEAAIRLAAFLNLTKPGSVAVLQDDHAALANLVGELTQCRVVGLDPAVEVADTHLTAAVRSDSRIPLASGAVDAVALTDSRYLEDAARVIRQGGRVLVPSALPLPAGFIELARDEAYVVAEASGPVVSLRRA